MTKGILLAAWGKRGYIYAAYNLAFSIKNYNRMIPITLYCQDGILNHLKDFEHDVFDDIVSIPKEILEKPAAEIKTSIYDMLPYDCTLFLDVDALCFQDLEPCLDEMIETGAPYYSHVLNLHTIDQGNDIPQMIWAKADVIWDHFKLPEDAVLPCTNSSFQFIRKCDESAKLIQAIKRNMSNQIPLEKLSDQWGAGQPDELYLNASLAQCGMTGKTHREYMFMGNVLSPKPMHVIEQEYYILSIFGGKRFTKEKYTEYYDKKLIKIFYGHGKYHNYKYQYILRDKHANTKPIKFTPEAKSRLNSQSPVYYGKSSDELVIYSAWYKTKTPQRQHELDTCLLKNLENKEVKKVVVVTEDECTVEHEKLVVERTASRPTYNTFLDIINAQTHEDQISMVCNADIWIDEANAKKIKSVNFTNRALALSRWDQDVNGFKKHFNYDFSQDTWIFKGHPKPVRCDSFLGIMQCDGRFAHELHEAGYEVINPSKDIQTFHIHKSGERNYNVHAEQEGTKRGVKNERMGDYVKKRLLIIQPGKTGDIIICAPMAKHFSSEYFVDWQCPVQYHAMFKHLPYCSPVSIVREKDYARVVDMSFGLGGKPEKWWQQNKKGFTSFVEAKYELAGLPLQLKNAFSWTRDTAREQALIEKLNLPAEFALVHDNSDYGTQAEVETALPVVKFLPVDDFTIFDWYGVILKATEIHCIDSSLCNFVDVCPEVRARLFYYITNRVPQQYDRTILGKDWQTINQYETSIAN